MDLRTKLANLGLELPDAPAPVAAYVPAVRTGRLIIVSGQLPLKQGSLLFKGPVPSAVTLDQAQQAARQCVLNALAMVDQQVQGDWTRFVRVVRVGVFVACDDSFTDQSLVANGASELLVDLFGEAGRHARAAVGVNALPLGAPLEVEMTVEIA